MGGRAGLRSVVEMDADGSHEPGFAAGPAGGLRRGADVAIGSRYVPGGDIPHGRGTGALLSRAGNIYSSRVLGARCQDATSGFRVYRSSLLRRLDLSRVRSDGYGFQIEMTYRAARHGARIAEVADHVWSTGSRARRRMSPWIVVEALMHVTAWGAARVLPSRRRTHAAT